MHIVLVEDDEVIRETTQLTLERFGYTVSVFADGRDGFEYVIEHGADVVLLDLMLPTMNGASICRELRERTDVPIIVISARSEPIDIVQALEAGADDYLTKPFDMQVLSARIRTVVRRYGASTAGFPSGDLAGNPAETSRNPTGSVPAPPAGAPRTTPRVGHARYPGQTSAAPESWSAEESQDAQQTRSAQPVSPARTARSGQGAAAVPPRAEVPARWARPAGSPARQAGTTRQPGSMRPGQVLPNAAPPDQPRTQPNTLDLGALQIDTSQLHVTLHDKPVHLTPTELRLLLLLADRPGHVYSREDIAHMVWGTDWAGDLRVVDVHIQRLRKKIGTRRVTTIRGFGYSLVA
ncbi:response regulator [Brevibacterium sp. 50QC2O2]|uniref:response regulator n=1 Tax=Brevibacterium sp. 50QC2O2 TaxID=2968459 RepID=UPI00211C92D1|nr:response regulator [Brevibacterium sp. 50QC2O2]